MKEWEKPEVSSIDITETETELYALLAFRPTHPSTEDRS